MADSNFTPEDLLEYKKDLSDRIEKGQLFERFIREGWAEALNVHIINPMLEESFEGFLTMDPNEVGAVVQIQKQGLIAKNIRERILLIVESGKEAATEKEELINSTQQGEDEL